MAVGSIDEVHAFAYRSSLSERNGLQSYDVYTVNFRAANGLIGRAMGHYGLHELPSARNAIELMLYGSDGTSMAQYHNMRYYHSAPDGTEIKEDTLYSQRGYYFNNEVHGMHHGEFANYAEYFALALLEGGAYSPDLEEGLETYCVMEAIRRSAQSGQLFQISAARGDWTTARLATRAVRAGIIRPTDSRRTPPAKRHVPAAGLTGCAARGAPAKRRHVRIRAQFRTCSVYPGEAGRFILGAGWIPQQPLHRRGAGQALGQFAGLPRVALRWSLA